MRSAVRRELELKGAGGEPVDFLRTLLSHGVADLPPFSVDRAGPALTATLPLGRTARTVTVSLERKGVARISVPGPPVSPSQEEEIVLAVRHILRLDEDLSEFYGIVAEDPVLSWAARGAGRMMRSPTVFEDVIKTICTTNCAWSATERMVGAMVAHLGKKAPGARSGERTFPSPKAILNAGDGFFRHTARTGYRERYILSLARMADSGEVDLAALDPGASPALTDDEAELKLLGLPGVGPYGAAHVMMMLGRYSRLILDSWTRPKYAYVAGKAASDEEIRERFHPYGRYAGLAFWLFVTHDWVGEDGRANR